jgi:hypothetical protein
MTSPAVADPFAERDSVPSLSFKDKPIGHTYEGIIASAPELVQGTDFETGEPAVWKNKDGSTSPKMSVVMRLEVDGEQRSLWAVKPSAMFAALKEAQQKAGKPFEVGGKIAVRYTGDKPNEKNPRLNAAKQYAVKYEPPAPKDAFADDSQPPW